MKYVIKLSVFTAENLIDKKAFVNRLEAFASSFVARIHEDEALNKTAEIVNVYGIAEEVKRR